MARLHVKSFQDGSEEEFPDIIAELNPTAKSMPRIPMSEDLERVEQQENASPMKRTGRREAKKPCTETYPVSTRPSKTVQASSNDSQIRKQKPLRLAHVNSLLLPLSSYSRPATTKHEKTIRDTKAKNLVQAIQKRSTRQIVDHKVISSDLELALPSDGDSSFDDLSDFIVNDSASDEELRRPCSVRKRIGTSPRKLYQKKQLDRLLRDELDVRDSPVVIDLTSPEKELIVRDWDQGLQISGKCSPPQFGGDFFGEPDANLKFSPPRKSPYKSTRFKTPPPSPKSFKLQSPSKSKNRIPPSPHRQSLDAFWSAEVINDWNDQYCLQKPPRNPPLYSVDEDDDGYLPPSCSPRRSPTRSPKKTDKDAVKRRKLWDAQKDDLATSFLQELDQTINNGKVSEMAASTGGIRIVWSKKLNSTAGRANWKREPVRTRNLDGIVISTEYKHHAVIELAEKVIDDEDRLLNVIAHEYCHLANFMISNIKTKPHGKEFKQWAQKVTHAFTHRSIIVTTKHSYLISYKYTWTCTLCQLEFQRHSRSIDPSRHTCGSCKGPLLQTQPAPRERKESAYQDFVKTNYACVRAELATVSAKVTAGEVMVVLGERWRRRSKEEEKESGKAAVDDGGVGLAPDPGLEDVARRLDFLSLAERF